MASNLTYFVDKLPGDFDTWNATTRYIYYSDHLYSFSSLDLDRQEWMVETLSADDLRGYSSYLEDLYRNNETLSWTAWDEGGLNSTFIYLNNLSMQEDEAPTKIECSDFEEAKLQFVLFMLIPAVLILLCITFWKKRRFCSLNVCYGRPGVQYPVNLIDEQGRRWAFIMVFCVLSYNLLELFDNKRLWQPPDSFTNKYPWTKVFVTLLNIIMLGLAYYPMLECLTLRRYIIINFVGLSYCVPWLVFQLFGYFQCSPTSKNEVEKVTTILQLIFDAPILVAYAVLIFSYVLDLVINIRNRCTKRTVSKKERANWRKRVFHEAPPIEYLEALLKRKLVGPMNTKEKIIRFFKYEPVTGFKYSLRMSCTVAVSSLVLYKFHTFVIWIFIFLRKIAKEIADTLGPDLLEVLNYDKNIYDFIMNIIDVLYYSCFVCFWSSFFLHVLFLLHMLIVYKRRMQSIMKGDHKWHHNNTDSPASSMAAGMRYSGYQIAYMLYGYLILACVLTLVALIIAYLLVLPLVFDYKSPLIEQLKKLWPTILIGLLIIRIQLLLAKFGFLQERGEYMALNNRRVYHVVSFFLFFFNVITGLFSCLRRILFSLIFGLPLISRLDYCIFMRGFERFDSGHKAYLGMLNVEMYHNNPLLKAFILILIDETKQRKAQGDVTHDDEKLSQISTVENGLRSIKLPKGKIYDKRIVRKWWKTMTIINNPIILVDRLSEHVKNKQAGTSVTDVIVDTAGTFLAGSVAVAAVDTFDTAL